LSLDLNTYSYVLALLFLYAFRRRRRRPALHSHSHTACSIGHRKPGALQKFLAFFLFRLGPREAFHAFFNAPCFVDAVAEIDGYIPPAAQLNKLLQAKIRFRGTFTVAFCTLL
jgi:hypothetical protein